MDMLNERERDIITKRHLEEPPLTLEALSAKYSISKERVRQLESRAMQKLQTSIKKEAKAIGYGS
mgnify:CR=1 FL=1